MDFNRKKTSHYMVFYRDGTINHDFITGMRPKEVAASDPNIVLIYPHMTPLWKEKPRPLGSAN